MTTKHAKDLNPPPLIALVVYPQVKLLDVSGALQVFSDARQAGMPAYRCELVSLSGGLITTDTGIGISSIRLADIAADTLLVCGGTGVHQACEEQSLVNQIRQHAVTARRTGSVCTGAFLLARTGLCSGKRLATHWQACQRLAEACPEAQIDAASIYVNDGIWSSAGVTAGIDMALAMVAEDLGKPEAIRLARSLVTYMLRPGNQKQFSDPLQFQQQDCSGRFDTLHNWIRQNLRNNLNLETLAARENMSLRSFQRHYQALTGTSPARAVQRLRLEAARDMLIYSQRNISVIARSCGFSSEKQLQRSFSRYFSTTPSQYRELFKETTDDAADNPASRA